MFPLWRDGDARGTIMVHSVWQCLILGIPRVIGAVLVGGLVAVTGLNAAAGCGSGGSCLQWSDFRITPEPSLFQTVDGSALTSPERAVRFDSRGRPAQENSARLALR